MRESKCVCTHAKRIHMVGVSENTYCRNVRCECITYVEKDAVKS